MRSTHRQNQECPQIVGHAAVAERCFMQCHLHRADLLFQGIAATKKGADVSGSEREQMVDQLAGLLDDWAAMVKTLHSATGKTQGSLARLLGTNATRVSKWFSGRKILIDGGASLPGVQVTNGLIQHLNPTPRQQEHLLRDAHRIDDLQRQLSRHHDWRKHATEHLLKDAAARESAHGEAVLDAEPLALQATEPSPSPTTQPDTAPSAVERNEPQQGLAVPVDQNKDRQQTTDEQHQSIKAHDQAEVRRASHSGFTASGWRGWPRGAKIGVSTLTAVFVVAGGTLLVSALTSDNAKTNGQTGEIDTGDTQTPPAGVNASDIEKDTLGRDSRCSAALPGPDAVNWRLCIRVTSEHVSFAVKVTNTGKTATSVKLKLQYVQAGQFHDCPTKTSSLLKISPGQMFATETRDCEIARQDVPYAYQASGCVISTYVNSCTYKLSPTAHVYPDHIKWQPDIF